MASTVCTAAPPLPTPPPAAPLAANKKAGRASSSVSWIKDKERASQEFPDHALQTHLLRPSSSTGHGRASLSKNWTDDKIERASRKNLLRPSSTVRGCAPLSKNCPSSTVRGCAPLSKNWTEDKIERAGIGCKRVSVTGSEIQRGEKKIRPDEHSAAAYYAGPAFNNSPHPSELSIPFFVKSPNASQISFAVIARRHQHLSTNYSTGMVRRGLCCRHRAGSTFLSVLLAIKETDSQFRDSLCLKVESLHLREHAVGVEW